MQPVIHSLLDTDLYKFTMWQAMLHRHPADAGRVHVRLPQRRRPIRSPNSLAEVEPRARPPVRAALPRRRARLPAAACASSRSDFVDFLRIFQFQRDFITRAPPTATTLEIVASGPQVHVMAFEIYVLAIVNELYFRRFDQRAALAEGRRRLAAKIERLRAFDREPKRRHPFEFFDFGVRRRFSARMAARGAGDAQARGAAVLQGHVRTCCSRASSASCRSARWRTNTCRPSRRSACGCATSRRAALEDWVQEYRGDLGTALTDVVGMDAFLADFDLYFAKLFDGLRHDSGDPVVWGEKALAHYAEAAHRRAAPSAWCSPTASTSTKAFALYRHFADRTPARLRHRHQPDQRHGPHARCNIVMKLTHAATASRSPSCRTARARLLCDDETFLAYLRQVFTMDT